MYIGGVGKEMGNACETYKRYIQYVLLKDRYDRDGGPSKFQAILVNRAYEHGDDAAQKMYNIIKVSGFLRCRRPDGEMIPDSIAIEEMEGQIVNKALQIFGGIGFSDCL